MLTPDQARDFYDRWGARQDSQGWYEDEPCRCLIDQSAFPEAGSVLEFGCGTGRFARELLQHHLPPGACYRGLDISSTMLQLSRERLKEFSDRVTLIETDGSMRLAADDQSVDRVVANYVLDLLSDADIRRFLNESHRVLRAGGRLCLVNLTHGPTWPTRLVSRLWGLVHWAAPRRVGGCRPLEVRPFLEDSHWELLCEEVLVAGNLASQIIVAAKET